MKNIRPYILTALLTIALGVIVNLGFSGRISALSVPYGPLRQFAVCGQNDASLFGFPAWDSCLPHKNGEKNGEIVITNINQLWLVILPIVESLVKIAGYAAVSMIIWGSILFVKSQGDPGKVTSARNTIRDAVIGLVIAASSVAIIQYISNDIANKFKFF
jgi:hypothetical protein